MLLFRPLDCSAYRRDLSKFLIANLKSGAFPGGVYLDMHSIVRQLLAVVVMTSSCSCAPELSLLCPHRM